MNIEGRYAFPSAAVKHRPTVRASIGRTGRSGASPRRRVERTRRPDPSPSVSSSSSSSTDSRSPPPSSWPGSTSTSGSSSMRCQPSAHWCIRSTRARFAHVGHRDSRVDPHGRTTVDASPLTRSTGGVPAGARTRLLLRPAQRPWPCPTPTAPAPARQGPSPDQPQRRWQPEPSKPP
jgi:hypothetical protein